MKRGAPLTRRTPLVAKTPLRNRTPLSGGCAPLRQRDLPNRSKRGRRDDRLYSEKRLAYLEADPACAWPDGDKHNAEQVHHKMGRIGALLLDESHWLPLCAVHHQWVTEHPKDALEMKLSERRVS